MKKCFKCGEEKPFNEFYRQKKMADGYLGKCKECTKADVTAHRAANIEAVREYDRERSKKPNRQEYATRHAAEWRKRNREKQRAQRKVAYEVRAGRLTAQPCAVCGREEHVHAHHEDYARPLDVIWLCAEHHAARHRSEG